MKLLRDLSVKYINLEINARLQAVYEKKDVQTIILDLNKFNQLFKEGVQDDGSDLSSTNSTVGTYSPETERINEGRTFSYKGLTKNKIAGDKYFLMDSGKFFTSFKIIISKDGFEITANTKKSKVDMIKEYGNILGLTEESKDILIQVLKPELITSLRV